MEKFEKNSKIKEHIDQSLQIARNTILSFIPGNDLITGFLDYRANLKQKRLIDFSESVKKALEDISGRKLNSSNFEAEDFVDVVEAIFLRVQNTRSEYKLQRFRNILVNRIIEPQLEEPMWMKFIQLLDELDDIQIYILCDFKYWKERGEKITSPLRAYQGDVGLKLGDSEVISTLLKKTEIQITRSELEYYLNQLISKGLIKNAAKSIPVQGLDSPHNNYQISSIGLSFLKFIELSK